MSNEESRLTLKVGVIASFVAAFVIFIMSALWGHQTDITVLKTNQTNVMETVRKLEIIPVELARINEQLRAMSAFGYTERKQKQPQELGIKK